MTANGEKEREILVVSAAVFFFFFGTAQSLSAEDAKFSHTIPASLPASDPLFLSLLFFLSFLVLLCFYSSSGFK